MSSLRDNSVSSTKRALFFSLAVAGVAVVLYLFAVQPCQDSIAKARRELDSLEGQLRVTTRDLRDSSRVKNMLSEIETARQPFMDALLTPLLESWAMRAKSKLDPLAADVGLKVVDYAEMPVRALPLPPLAPRQLYARRPIRVMARGSYAEIASFIGSRVSRHMPKLPSSMAVGTCSDVPPRYASSKSWIEHAPLPARWVMYPSRARAIR